MNFAIAVCLITMAAVNGERQGILLPDGSIVKFDVFKNVEENTKLFILGDTKKPGQLNGIKFHDFNTDYKASKLINEGLCLISSIKNINPVHITAELLQMPPVVFRRISKTPMSEEEIVSVAGKRIADFCHGYRSHQLIEGKHISPKRAALDHGIVYKQDTLLKFDEHVPNVDKKLDEIDLANGPVRVYD